MKRLMPLIIFILCVFKVAAQNAPAQSAKELLLAIQKSKPDTNRISLQLKLGGYYLFKPGEYKNDLDSAYNFFNQATQLSIKLHEVDCQYRTLRMMGYYYSEARDVVHGRQCFMRVIAYYQQKGEHSKEADIWFTLGESLYLNHDKYGHEEERVGYYQHARSLYAQNHDPESAATVLKSIADVHWRNKQFTLAENEMLQVIAQYKALKSKKTQDAYDMLYDLEYAMGNYNRALFYCSEGIKSMKASRDTALAAHFYFAMARCNYGEKNYEEALRWARKSVAATDKNAPSDNETFLLQVLLTSNRTAEARTVLNHVSSRKPPKNQAEAMAQYMMFARFYNDVKDVNGALRYYNKVLKIDKKAVDLTFYNVAYLLCNNEMAMIYLKTKQIAEAGKYMNNSIAIIKNATTPLQPGYYINFYSDLYKYDIATGNYQAAVKDLERRDKIQDSLFTANKDQQISELNVQYQTFQKEQSIKDLHSQSAVQQARLDKANLQRNITIGGILVMILISALFYRNYRQKQAANNIITHKNDLLQHLLTEKEWLLKEVHHRVKNNLHTVICLLESQAQYLENDALKAIENSQHRIYAMSLIHQKLYQSDDIKTIDMAEYIPELVKSLEEGFDTSDQIKFNLKIDPINLDISHAIPLGLIINEAVTNSIKYAFPDARKGEISISMFNNGDLIKLELADNGIGIPDIHSEDEPESMGLRLMKGLSEDIDAEIGFKVDNGTRIMIVFKPDALNKQENILRSLEIKEGSYA
jgi:two-component sensor histidine kinase